MQPKYAMITTSLPFKKQLKILGFKACSKIEQQQFMRMGIIPGVLLTLERKAPLGDPIEVCIRNTRIALSKAMLQKLQIEVPV